MLNIQGLFATVLLKLCLDGFSILRGDQKLESHFQFGYTIVQLASHFVPNVNSREAFRPIAKSVDKEKVCIPLVIAFMDATVSANFTVQLIKNT